MDDWSSSGEYQSSEVFKMYALRLFYVSSFGRADEEVIATLHDDFKTWIGGFMAVTVKRISGAATAKRVLGTVTVKRVSGLASWGLLQRSGSGRLLQ